MNEGREAAAARHWRFNKRLVLGLLVVWFTVSYGLGILLVEPLNAVRVGGFPLGFWFAQQGAIFVFVGLILAYCVAMDRADARALGEAGEGE